MRNAIAGFVLCLLSLVAVAPLRAQQGPEAFYWVNFHSEKDRNIVTWVERALTVEDWTAIREIGVEYDAALVVTSKRATAQTAANADSFTVWHVSLTKPGEYYPLVKGVSPRWFDWMRFADGSPEELPLVYNNCRECSANTYFTAFHYDVARHAWAARWLHGGEGIPLWTDSTPAGVAWTQVYAAVSEPNGRALLYTWSHFDYGKDKEESDSIYRYDLDPRSGLERSLPLLGKDAEAAKLRLCSGQDAIPGLARGQDSEMCVKMVGKRPAHRVVTTPPANNRGSIGRR